MHSMVMPREIQLVQLMWLDRRVAVDVVKRRLCHAFLVIFLYFQAYGYVFRFICMYVRVFPYIFVYF